MERICAPVAGRTVPMAQIPDPTFSRGLLGEGIAIQPTEGKIYAPCDGVVESVLETGHAICLVSEAGAEILIHVGIGTVAMEGKPFRIHVREGEQVTTGRLLMEADLEYIRAAGMPVITPVLVCNSFSYASVQAVTGADVSAGDVLLELVR